MHKFSIKLLPGTLLLFLLCAVLLPSLLAPLAAPASSASAQDDPGCSEDPANVSPAVDRPDREAGGDGPPSDGDPDDYDVWNPPCPPWALEFYREFYLLMVF